MSQSPLRPGEPGEPGTETEDYATAWAAINKLLRRGYSWSGREPNCAFLNLRDGRFADVSAASGFDFPDDARATALLDWDHDGDQDVLLSARSGPRVRFLRNDQGSEHGSLTLELRGTRSNRDAIGARVELALRNGDVPRTLVRAVRAGEGYLAQSSSRLTIGLGPRAVLERALVRWPGGASEEFSDLAPGGAYRLVEGSGRAERLALPAPPKPLPSSTPRPPVASLAARVPLARPVPLPRIELLSPEGQLLPLFGLEGGGGSKGTGKPVLLDLFSSRCAPCAEELGALARRAGELERSGIAFLALCVDPEQERERAPGFLSDLGWPFPWAYAARESVEVLDALQGILLDRERRLPLPTSFLVDAAGALRVLYLGPLDADQLLADRELLQLGEGALLDEATPFAGRWMFPALPADADFFEGRLTSRGLEAAAREYGRGRLQVVRSAPADLLHDFGRRSAAEQRFDEAIDFFRRALAADPRHFDTLVDLALVLHRQEKLDLAARHYQKALALRPDHEDTRFNLALALLGLGQRAAAENQLAWLKARGKESAAVLEQAIQEFGGPR